MVLHKKVSGKVLSFTIKLNLISKEKYDGPDEVSMQRIF